ncbi:hypothetical protein WICPIJ_004925 [Wickerhamomyces pijperi]|uniref:Uncharacterized protein n=1 Tax=Wickerhamomyces pijperi TaxID=599730 RepID=A0A9P8Q4W5_WICPI|nr:hypothetical protein WICPIJ_004925 [Wickerhamomyces pijperi]
MLKPSDLTVDRVTFFRDTKEPHSRGTISQGFFGIQLLENDIMGLRGEIGWKRWSIPNLVIMFRGRLIV